MKVVHLGTRVISLFGVLDDDGNVVNRAPVELSTEVLSADSILQLLEQIQAVRAEAERTISDAHTPSEHDDSPALSFSELEQMDID